MKIKTKGFIAILLIVVLFAGSFLVTSFCFWILTLAFRAFDLIITFTWGRAFAFWLIAAIIKILFRGLTKEKE